MSQWLVIGISGVTCGGKTTLAQKIHQFFDNHKDEQITNSNFIIGDTILFSQDNYFLPINDERHQHMQQINAINWEIITALDMDRLLFDIRNILKDNYLLYDNHIINNFNQTTTTSSPPPTTSQLFNKSSSSSSTTTATTFQNNNNKLNILIIEGFLIFNHPQLLQIFQLKFHIHLPFEKCYERRQKRTYEPPDCIGYFEMCVWPMYEKHFRDFKDRKDILMLNGEISRERIFKFVLNCIHDIL